MPRNRSGRRRMSIPGREPRRRSAHESSTPSRHGRNGAGNDREMRGESVPAQRSVLVQQVEIQFRVGLEVAQSYSRANLAQYLARVHVHPANALARDERDSPGKHRCAWPEQFAFEGAQSPFDLTVAAKAHRAAPRGAGDHPLADRQEREGSAAEVEPPFPKRLAFDPETEKSSVPNALSCEKDPVP